MNSFYRSVSIKLGVITLMMLGLDNFNGVFGRDYIDVGAGILCVEKASGKVISTYHPTMMALVYAEDFANPFLCSADGSLVYLGYFEAKRDDISAGDNKDGSLIPRAMTFTIPQLKSASIARPDPTWKSRMEPLPSNGMLGDERAVTKYDLLLVNEKKVFKISGTPNGDKVPLGKEKRGVTFQKPWKSEEMASIFEQFFLDDHLVFVFTGFKTFWCFNVLSGKLLWKFEKEFQDPDSARLVVYPWDKDTYLLSTSIGGLFLIEAITGKIKWHVDYANWYGPPSIIDTGKYLIVGPVLGYQESKVKK